MPIIDAANCVQKDNFHDAIYKYLWLYYKKHPSHNIQFIEELGWFGENTVDSRLEYMLYSLDYLVRYSWNKWLETNHPDKLHAMDSRIDEWKEYYWCQVLSLPMTWWKPPRIEGRRKANLDALLDL